MPRVSNKYAAFIKRFQAAKLNDATATDDVRLWLKKRRRPLPKYRSCRRLELGIRLQFAAAPQYEVTEIAREDTDEKRHIATQILDFAQRQNK